MATKTKKTATFMIKREYWIEHAIDCPERAAIIEEIKYQVGKCCTRRLVDTILPLVCSHSEEDILSDPMVQRFDYDPQDMPEGLILVEDK